MKFRLLGLFILFFLLAVSMGLPGDALAQKGTDRKVDDKKSNSDKKSQPKGTTRTVKESERVRAISKPEFIKIVVRPNKGYLSVVAFRSATVILTPLPENQKKEAAIREIIKNEDGSLNLINLLPGKYKIAIEHDDYHPYSENVQVDPARPDTFVAINKMISKYGDLRIGGVPSGAKIFLDESSIDPSRMKQENQNIVISRIPVKKYKLKISKDGYTDYAAEIEVVPGDNNFVSPNLGLATVSLNLKSLPGARVYVGSEEKSVIPSLGTVTIPLAPGRHTVTVSKDGYQDWKKELILSLANNPVTELANLVPIPSSAEGNWDPSMRGLKWYPQSNGWRFDPSSGARVMGDKVVLFDTEPNRDFSHYANFKLEFNVEFANGKGVAWVARAKDLNNYYLFEISGVQSGNQTFHFFVCKDGKLEWKDSQRIPERLDRKGDSFHLVFEASGNKFETRMEITNAPSARPHRIGIFEDNTFPIGGVGFRGKDQSEFLLQSFFVFPDRK